MKSVADIKVGYLCNNRCLHCAIGDMKRDLEQDGVSTDLTTEQVFQLLEQQSKDADGCVLTGGEITLRKDCAQLINKAISLCESVQIQTNGRRITQQLIDSICDLKNVTLLLPFMDPYQFMTRLHALKTVIHKRLKVLRYSVEHMPKYA